MSGKNLENVLMPKQIVLSNDKGSSIKYVTTDEGEDGGQIKVTYGWTLMIFKKIQSYVYIM